MLNPSDAQTLNLSPEMMKWIGGAVVGVIGAMFTVLGVILRVAHNLGKDSQKIATGLQTLDKFEPVVKQVPILVEQVGTLRGLYEQNRSDIKELLRDKRGSRPDPYEREGR